MGLKAYKIIVLHDLYDFLSRLSHEHLAWSDQTCIIITGACFHCREVTRKICVSHIHFSKYFIKVHNTFQSHKHSLLLNFQNNNIWT